MGASLLHYGKVVTICLASWFFFLCFLMWWPLYNSLYRLYLLLYKAFQNVNDRKRVVVVGGGFAGAMVASKLEADFEVTLIDSRSYSEYTPSILRVLVEESHLPATRLEHNKYLKNARVLVDEVTDIRYEPNTVTTSGGTPVDFDYLVLCTGSGVRNILSGPKIYHGYSLQSLQASQQDLLKAKKVLIMGGGTVGVELAAEIIERFPQKNVTIAQTGPLLGRYPPAAGDYATKWLKKHGVNILSERIITQLRVGVFQTESGEEINADVVYLCAGGSPNSGFLRNKFSEAFDDSGYARVNEHLQFEINDNTFVAGDLLGVSEEKLAQAAQNSASLVASNIRLKAKGKALIKYPYAAQGIKQDSLRKLPLVISLGKYAGIFIFQGVLPVPIMEGAVFTGFLPALLKDVVEWKWRFTFP